MARKSKSIENPAARISVEAADKATGARLGDFIAKSIAPRFGAAITATQVAWVRYVLRAQKVATPGALAKRLKYKSQAALIADLKRVAGGDTRTTGLPPATRDFLAGLTEPLKDVHAANGRVYKMWHRKNAAIVYGIMTEKPAPKKRAPKVKVEAAAPASDAPTGE